MKRISANVFPKTGYLSNFMTQTFYFNLSDAFVENLIEDEISSKENKPVVLFNFNPKISNLTVDATLKREISHVTLMGVDFYKIWIRSPRS